MVVTKTYVAGGSQSRTEVDAKDVGSVHFTANCGVGEAHPAAIYIRPFCVDQAIFKDDETVSEGEMPIRKSLIPVAFAENLKEELEKLAPARILEADEVPHVAGLQSSVCCRLAGFNTRDIYSALLVRIPGKFAQFRIAGWEEIKA